MDSGRHADEGGNKGGSEAESLTPPLNAAIIPQLFQAEVQEKRLARRISVLQALAVVLAAAAVHGWEGSPQNAIAVLGGGMVAILNSGLLAWRMYRTARQPIHDAHQQLRLMYFYAAERYLAVVAALAICMALLRLPPLAVVGGFALGQAVLLAARLLLRIKTESGSKNVQ